MSFIHSRYLVVCACLVFFAATATAGPPTFKLQKIEGSDLYQLTVSGEHSFYQAEVIIHPEEPVCQPIPDGLTFCGTLEKNGNVFRGFIKSGAYQYPVILRQTEEDKWEGNWNKVVRYERTIRPGDEISEAMAGIQLTGYKH